ncbi:MAG: hypothetical protein H6702_06905 [Myxococcales bacterium]|nr:hypothetical protein [Myxococcales bacterium]
MACPVPKYHRKGMTRRADRKRCILPGKWNFCTSRTQRGEYCFSELDDDDRLVLWGFVAFAAKLYGVDLAFVFVMSNHLHIICRAQIPEAVSLFHGHFKAQFARYIHRKHGRTGAVWGGRFHNVNLLDDEAQVRAMTYGIDHGMKESLVARSDEWHLPHTINELCGDGWLHGVVWRRRVGDVKGEWCRIKQRLVPLDRWADNPAGYRTFIKQLLEERVQHYTELRAAQREGYGKLRAAYREAGLDPDDYDLPDGRLKGIIRQHDYVPTVIKSSRGTRFRAVGPDREAELKAAREAHVAACEVYDATVASLVAGTFVGEPTLPEGYQWPTAIAAALGVGVVCSTWAEIFRETEPIPPGSAWARAG